MADTRFLTDNEIWYAKTVFQDHLPYDLILIANDLGWYDVGWTQYEPFSKNYVIHSGKGFDIELTSGQWVDNIGIPTRFLIHELTHVWQGATNYWHAGYMVQAGLCQIGAITSGDRNNAYDYTPNQDWDSYTPEQQAKVVEDWSANGSYTNENYRYVRDYIQSKYPVTGQSYGVWTQVRPASDAWSPP